VDSLLLALRVIVALGVVIAVIWFLRKRNSPAGRGRRVPKPVSVIARQNLAPKVSVAVVEFGGKRFLLGVSEHGVTVLHDEELELADEAPAAVPALVPVDTSRDFATKLTLAEKATAAGSSSGVRLARDPSIDAAFAASSSKIAGSVLSAATWKQAWAAIRTMR
jgi:flagellar protein FliO/FliZ